MLTKLVKLIFLSLVTCFMVAACSQCNSTSVSKTQYIATLDAQCSNFYKHEEEVLGNSSALFGVAILEKRYADSIAFIQTLEKLPRPTEDSDTLTTLFSELYGIEELMGPKLLVQLRRIVVAKNVDEINAAEAEMKRSKAEVDARYKEMSKMAMKYGFASCFIDEREFEAPS